MARHNAKQAATPAEQRLLALSELPESHLTKDELAELDTWIAEKTAAIRAAWTPEQEAMARGVRFRQGDRQCEYDSRIFQRRMVQVVDASDLERAELRGVLCDD